MTPSFTRRVLTVLGFTGLAVVCAFFLYGATKVFLLSFVGVLIGVFLHSVASLLRRHTPLPQGLALALTLVLITGLLVGFSFVAGPQLSEQLRGLTEQLPSALSQLEGRLERFGWGQRLLESVPSLEAPAQTQDPASAEATLSSVVPNVAGRLLSLLSGVATTLGDGFYALLMGIFFASAAGTYRAGVRHLFPKTWRDEADEVLREIYRTLQGWLLGQLVAMLTLGVVVGIGLSVLGVPFALGLGFIAFLFEFIPTVGPWLAGLPAVLMALTVSPTMALWVAGLFVVVELLEGNLLLPIIHQRTVDMPPALSLFAIFLMGTLFGLLGVLVAAPLAAVLLTTVKMLYLRDELGDEVSLPGEKTAANKTAGAKTN